MEAAEACARYLTQERAGRLYEEASKLTACRSLLSGDTQPVQEEESSLFGYRSLYESLLGDQESAAPVSSEHLTVYEAYEKAAEVPTIMELSNMWLQLEVILADIWRGQDAGEKVSGFAGLLEAQLD